jgi:hypothetical protein
MESQDSQPPVGIFEGYMKKRKNIAALTLLGDCNKRYFYLDLSTYGMVYYKNRKKSGTPVEVPLREILAVIRVDGDTGQILAGKEWAYQFFIVTRTRSYDLRAYSWNDREVWMKGLNRLIEYKKKILARRGVSLDNLEISIFDPPKSTKYDLKPSDFGQGGKVLPLDQIPIEEPEEDPEDKAKENVTNEEKLSKSDENAQISPDEDEVNREGITRQRQQNEYGEQPQDDYPEGETVRINCEDGSAKSYSDSQSERNENSARSSNSDYQTSERLPSKFGR